VEWQEDCQPIGNGRLGAMTYGDIHKEHIADYQALFSRVTLDLGDSPEGAAKLTTPQRLDAYRGSKVKGQKGTTYEQDALNLTGAGRTRAYPLLKELCEFWEDSLIEWPNGKLVSPKSVSPEHGPPSEGNSYEQPLIYDLFSNYIEASTILGKDEDFRWKVESMRSRLLGPQIGQWGQLQEWAKDLDKPVKR
jgi:hypothetical protein